MMNKMLKNKSVLKFIILLVGLSVPIWVLGAIFDVEIFPGFKLYQLSLVIPAVSAMILIYNEQGKSGIISLLKRTYDIAKLRPRIWYLPIFFVYPSIGLINYLYLRASGIAVANPQFSLGIFLGYSTVFFMTYGEELGLTGFLIDRLQKHYHAVTAAIFVGIIWAGYHIPIFIISGYYSFSWIVWHALYTIAGRVLFVWLYNNSGKSMFSMALMHWTFGIFWILFPQTGNLHKAHPYYDPQIAAIICIAYAGIVVLLWGAKTLAAYRFPRKISN